MAEEDDFACRAIAAIQLKLVRKPSDMSRNDLIFHPRFVDQMFLGDVIYGYKNLKINIFFSASSLVPYLGLEYDEVRINEVEPDDVISAVGKYLDKGTSLERKDFLYRCVEDNHSEPFGTVINSFTIRYPITNEEHYFDVYMLSGSDPGYEIINARMLPFLLWFIPAASNPEKNDPNWKFFMVYEKFLDAFTKGDVCFAAYLSAYEFYKFPDGKRVRISQVLTLPLFQNKSICPALLECVYKHYREDHLIVDITVEEPGEDFQRVRDFVDSRLCLKLPQFSRTNVLQGPNPEMINAAMIIYKLSKKQVKRVLRIVWLYMIQPGTPEFEEYIKFLQKTTKQEIEKARIKTYAMLSDRMEHVANERKINTITLESLKETVTEAVKTYNKVVKRLRRHRV